MDLRTRKLLVSFCLFVCAVLDIISDWYAFSGFRGHSVTQIDHMLTVVLGVVCGVSTLLFGLETFNFCRTYRILRRARGRAAPTPEEETLQTWQEVVTFGQTVVEDFPITLVMYFTLRDSSCHLFVRIFQKSYVGNIALLATFGSSFAKMVTSLFYCCTGYEGVTCGRSGLCFFCRVFRALVGLFLMGFSAYLFVNVLMKGTDYREECRDLSN